MGMARTSKARKTKAATKDASVVHLPRAPKRLTTVPHRNNHPTRPARLSAFEKQQRAFALRLSGKSFPEIAIEMGLGNPDSTIASKRTSAYVLVKRELDRRLKEHNEAVDEVRQIELARCDAMQERLWAMFESGGEDLRQLDQKGFRAGQAKSATDTGPDNGEGADAKANSGPAVQPTSPPGLRNGAAPSSALPDTPDLREVVTGAIEVKRTLRQPGILPIVDRLLRIMERRARLLGLDQTQDKIDANSNDILGGKKMGGRMIDIILSAADKAIEEEAERAKEEAVVVPFTVVGNVAGDGGAA